MAAIKSQTTVSGDVLADPNYWDDYEGKGPRLTLMLLYAPRHWDETEGRWQQSDSGQTRIKLQYSGNAARRVHLLFDRGVLRIGLPVHAHGRVSDTPCVRKYRGRLETSHLVYAEDLDVDLVTLATRDPQLTGFTAVA
ncbi:hypothetical protein [Bifidobacterium biavatii]|uniref:Uncharacterized protein n=1 Tax=Bifidobacterium biavatii DSM 23969 TaxID=1437608 RepID=A0A086ZDA7_9BIFI|nr:hypothetical protein [Bifidobacterium biavatii]KFI44507.1 hypothetical protein BBIA_2415 [Bifidobacterium biavatii DSM 23969]